VLELVPVFGLVRNSLYIKQTRGVLELVPMFGLVRNSLYIKQTK
jgi:hypothetical protein